MSGLPCATFIPCYVTGRQFIQRRTQRPSLLLTMCYLLGHVLRSAFSVVVDDVFTAAFPLGEYIFCTLTTPRVNGKAGTPICVHRVKLRLPCSLVAAEIANSSAELIEQRLA